MNKAIDTIKPEEACEGKLSEIVIEIAKIHQNNKDLLLCNETMRKGTAINYKLIEDYFSVWTQWAEILMEEKYYQDALKIIKHVLFRRRPTQGEELKIKNIDELLKAHTGIWQLYIDLEISLGNF